MMPRSVHLHRFNTRDVFYVRIVVDLMKTAKVNAYIMYIIVVMRSVAVFSGFLAENSLGLEFGEYPKSELNSAFRRILLQ